MFIWFKVNGHEVFRSYLQGMAESLIIHMLFRRQMLNAKLICVISCPIMAYLISQSGLRSIIVHQKIVIAVISSYTMEIWGGCKWSQGIGLAYMFFFLLQHPACHRRKYWDLRPWSVYDRLSEASTLSFINFWVSGGGIDFTALLKQGHWVTMSGLLEIMILLM